MVTDNLSTVTSILIYIFLMSVADWAVQYFVLSLVAITIAGETSVINYLVC